MFFHYHHSTIIAALFTLSLEHLFTVFTNKYTVESTRQFDDLTQLGWPVYCKFQHNSYRCGLLRTELRFYFDMKLHQCVEFEYGNCNNSYNLFTNRVLCRSTCRDVAYHEAWTNTSENVYCRYQPDFGECNSYHPMWYYDVSEIRCKGFAYSGCGGNQNRFPNPTICMSICGSAVKN